MTFNCCQKPFFSHKRAQSLSKNLFFAAISSQNYAFAKRYVNVVFCIAAKKTAYSTSNNALQKPTKQAITARQGVNSKPVGAKEAYELRRHFHHTGGTQKQRLPQPTKWRSRRTARQPLADITLDGRTWQPRLPPPPWAHREKACPFPRNQQKVFFM